MLRAIAQFETELCAERQMDGMLKAKAQGVPLGWRKILMPAQVVELRDQRQQGPSIHTLMCEFNLSKVTIYRYLGAAVQAADADHLAADPPPLSISAPLEIPRQEQTSPTPAAADAQAWRETVQPVM